MISTTMTDPIARSAEPIEDSVGVSLWKDAYHRLLRNKLAVFGSNAPAKFEMGVVFTNGTAVTMGTLTAQRPNDGPPMEQIVGIGAMLRKDAQTGGALRIEATLASDGIDTPIGA